MTHIHVSGRYFATSENDAIYWVTQKPQISAVILRIRIGKVVLFAVYICGNFLVTQ